MGVEVAVLAGGAALSAYGQYTGAKSEAEAARLQAALKEAQAKEVIRRAKLNESDIIRSGDQLLATQQTVQVGQGGSVASGNLILAQADAQYNILRDIVINMDEATFQAGQIRAGASIDRDIASKRETAGAIQAAGTLLTAGSRGFRAGGG